MLDKKTEMMLSVANVLTAEDLDQIRASAPASTAVLDPPTSVMENVRAKEASHEAEEPPSGHAGPIQPRRKSTKSSPPRSAGITQGELERRRTRESKIATGCVGTSRQKHEWWPIGTELVAYINHERFTGIVMENPQVKSGRSIRITSGAATGTVCKTPTRAALEATEAYRQANNLGRAGGVTNGWDFWKAST